MRLKLTLFCVAIGCLVFACRSPTQEAAKELTSSSIELTDSRENRRRLAAEVVSVYPQAEFGRDLSRQVAEITGKDVVDSAAQRIMARFSAEEFAQKRIDLYVRNFTAPELAKLKELYSSAEGRGLLEGLEANRKSWTEFLTPFVLEALTNQSEAIKQKQN